QGLIRRSDQTVPGSADVIGVISCAQSGFGGNDNPVAPPLYRRTQNPLRFSVRIDIGGIKQIDAVLQAYVDQTSGLVGLGITPSAKKRPFAAKGTGAETQHRY